jgi:hypothetical protein
MVKMLFVCTALATFEQPVGHTTQGFVNRITVEVCRSQGSPDADVVVTEQMVVGSTGQAVGKERWTRYSLTAPPPIPAERDAPSARP